METTAKILSVQENQRQWDWQGTKFFDHHIKYEGSDQVWIYSSKSDKCEKFRVGETATFTTEVKQNGQYTTHKIKPVQQQGGGGFKKPEPKNNGTITYLSCFSSACNFYAHRGQVTPDDVIALAERGFQEAVKHSTLAQPVQAAAQTSAPAPKPALLENTEAFKQAVQFIAGGGTIEQIEKKYSVSPAVKAALIMSNVSDVPF